MNYVTVEQLYAFTTLLFLVGSMSVGATVGVVKIVLYIMQHNHNKKK